MIGSENVATEPKDRIGSFRWGFDVYEFYVSPKHLHDRMGSRSVVGQDARVMERPDTWSNFVAKALPRCSTQAEADCDVAPFWWKGDVFLPRGWYILTLQRRDRGSWNVVVRTYFGIPTARHPMTVYGQMHIGPRTVRKVEYELYSEPVDGVLHGAFEERVLPGIFAVCG